MTPRSGSNPSPASSDPTDPLWKALAFYRTATVVYVVVAYAVLAEYYRRPESGWVVVAALAAWTVAVSALYRRPDRRTWPILSADLGLALLAVLLNPVIDQPDRIEAGEPTMALIWPTGALLAWAIRWGWRGGVGAAAALSVASLLARGELTRSTGNNIVLMVLAGAVIGYAVDLFRLSEKTMQQAVRMEAATRERERLSRSIHDGVLQVLALVQRRGPDLGAEGAELAQLAEEQQEALRGLLIAHPESTSLRSSTLLRLWLHWVRQRSRSRPRVSRCGCPSERPMSFLEPSTRAWTTSVRTSDRMHLPGCCWRRSQTASSSPSETKVRALLKADCRRQLMRAGLVSPSRFVAASRTWAALRPSRRRRVKEPRWS